MKTYVYVGTETETGRPRIRRLVNVTTGYW